MSSIRPLRVGDEVKTTWNITDISQKKRQQR